MSRGNWAARSAELEVTPHPSATADTLFPRRGLGERMTLQPICCRSQATDALTFSSPSVSMEKTLSQFRFFNSWIHWAMLSAITPCPMGSTAAETTWFLTTDATNERGSTTLAMDGTHTCHAGKSKGKCSLKRQKHI